jgi:hypothetical protein
VSVYTASRTFPFDPLSIAWALRSLAASIATSTKLAAILPLPPLFRSAFARMCRDTMPCRWFESLTTGNELYILPRSSFFFSTAATRSGLMRSFNCGA